MLSDTKPILRRLVVVGASTVLPATVVSLGEAAYDLASDVWDRPTAWIDRNLKKVTAAATAQERINGIRFATVALEQASLTVEQLVHDDFDAARAAKRIEPFLDSTLTAREHDVALHAVRLCLTAIVRQAKDSGQDLRAYARQNLSQLTQVQSTVDRIQAESQRHAPFESRSQHIVDSHRASDVLHRDLYVGKLPELALRQLFSGWKESVRSSVQNLRALRSSRAAPTKALSALEAVSLVGTYPSVWRKLQSPDIHTAISVIDKFVTQAAEVGIDPRYRDSLRFLQRQISSPEFSLVFPVSGSWGSGKTRWLDRIAEISLGEGWLPIHVQPAAQGGRTFQEQIFASFADTLGVRIASVPDLKKALHARHGSIVLIDDWDAIFGRQQGAQRELEALIETLSDIDVRWAITVDESALPTVLAHGGAAFWRRYGCSAPEVTSGKSVVSGWFLLDDENELEGVGLKIIAEHSPGGKAPEVAAVNSRASTASQIRRSLSSPLVALLKLELDPSIPLDEVHVISLLASYWRLMKDSLAQSDGVGDDAVDAVCEGIGFRRLQGRTATVLDVAGSVPDGYFEKEWESVTRAAIVCLRDRKVVSLVSGDRLLPSPTNDLLWGFLISQEVERHPAGRGYEGLPYTKEDLLALAQRGRTGESGDLIAVLRFLLVAHALDYEQAATENGRSYVRWLRNPDLPNDVLWEAASVLPRSAQTRLISEAMTVTHIGLDEPFWALRLLRLADPPSPRQSLPDLRFVARVASRANSVGLQDYVALVTKGIISQINWSAPRDATEALCLMQSISAPQTVDALCSSVVSQLSFEARKSRLSWLRTLKQFLTMLEDDSVEDGFTAPFWLGLTRTSMSSLSARVGPEAILDMLEAGIFLDSARGRHLSRAAGHYLRRSAHVAFGHSRHLDSSTFDELALQLIKGELKGASAERQVLAALFGIRHTVATWGGTVTVDRALETHLSLLNDSRYINGDMRKWVDSIQLDDTPSTDQEGLDDGSRS
jgi:hypothetical protein